MAFHKDLHQYLKVLEEQGKLTRIKREINKDTELFPLVRLQFRGLSEDERTAFLFENVIDSRGQKYDIPVVVGALAGSAQIYAIGMMCQPEEIAERMGRAELHPIEPRLVDSGPVQEEVHLGDNLLEHGGLEEFPITITTPGWDPSPYITAPCWVTKDPETGMPNMGMYRAMVKSLTSTGVCFDGPNKGGLLHWRKCKERGIPLEAAIIIGGPPNIAYVSVARLPVGVNEFSVAGGIAGEPVELVKCKTVNLEVPANAEIVIEGEMGTAELEPEAPFGEYLGFQGQVDVMPWFTVKCITHRKQPIWLDIIAQYPPSESSKITQFGNAGTVYKHLRYDLNMTHVSSVVLSDSIGGSRGFMVIKVKKTEPAEVWRTLEAAAKRFTLAKFIIAVDEDVNIRDLDSINLAMCVRTQPHRDYRIVKVLPPTVIDPSLYPPDKRVSIVAEKQDASPAETPEASLMLIDATMKWPYPPLSLPKKEFMEQALRIWQEEGLPQLKLKEPWWGINLGYWNEEKEELAMSAVKGEYYNAGALYAKRRIPA